MIFLTPSTPMLHLCRTRNLLGVVSTLLLELLLLLLADLLIDLSTPGWLVAVSASLRFICQRL